MFNLFVVLEYYIIKWFSSQGNNANWYSGSSFFDAPLVEAYKLCINNNKVLIPKLLGSIMGLQ